jgi:hypothetical protein
MKQSPIRPKWLSYCRSSIFESTALSALTYYISCCPRLNPSFLPASAARCPPQRTPPAANPHTTRGLRLHLRPAAATPTSTNSAPGLHLRLRAPPRLRCAPHLVSAALLLRALRRGRRRSARDSKIPVLHFLTSKSPSPGTSSPPQLPPQPNLLMPRQLGCSGFQIPWPPWPLGPSSTSPLTATFPTSSSPACTSHA